MEEVKIEVCVPKDLKEIFREVLIEEKRDKNLKEKGGEFIFDDFPKKKKYARWWRQEVKPKRIFLKFSESGFGKNERLTFILHPDEWVRGWFEYSKEGSKIYIKFNPIREKEGEKGKILIRQILNSIVGIVRWKEVREKFFMLPWGPRPGQKMEWLMEFSELGFLFPLNERDIKEVPRRKKEGLRKVVTGICLHSTRERRKIVERLNEDKVSKVKKILKNLPSFIKEINVFTFHPDDVEFMKENKMESAILPEILRAPDLKNQLGHHWKLTQEIFSSVPKEVKFYSIQDLFSGLEIKKIENEAKRRAEKMLEFILKSPPPVFRFLSPEEQMRRVEAEAKLLLAVTWRFSRDSLFYLGLEVHSRYWEMGKLYEWGDFYLPTLWLPSELRQPWGF